MVFLIYKQSLEKTQKQKNGSTLKSGQNQKKLAKSPFLPTRGPPKVKGSIFDDFALISKCCHLPVSGSFLSIFFCLNASIEQNENCCFFPKIYCNKKVLSGNLNNRLGGSCSLCHNSVRNYNQT